MFDVKKLAKLLEEIFTRDNENFSPELVAEELNERSVEVVEKDATADREAFITEKEFLSWKREVIEKLTKEHCEWPYQIDEAFFRKIKGEWVSVFALPAISIKTDDGRYKLAIGGVIITRQEFKEMLSALKSVRDPLPSKNRKPTGFGTDTMYTLK